MIYLLYSLLILFGSLYYCWVLFLAVMALYRAKLAGTLTITQKILGYPLLYFALFVDTLVNLGPCTLLFGFDLPKEWLTTFRLIRLKKDTGWRGKLARYLCRQLDNIDPTGCHCKEPNESPE